MLTNTHQGCRLIELKGGKMFIRMIVIGVNRALGVVLIFIYTVGTILMIVGIIDTTAFLKETMRISCIGLPTMLAEKRYIREDLEKEELSARTKNI